ncbi:MAG: helix-turn-helix transcriptional regulator [Candidatus Thermoplasmatota archaeon]
MKKDLENIVLELLSTQPLCGYDLIKALFQKYELIISPGTIYPLLYELEAKGILKVEIRKGARTKIYSLAKK